MKHYFLVAKDVGDLTRIFCAALEEMHAKPKPMLDRVLHHTFRRRKKSLPGTPQFIIDNDRLSVTDDEVFAARSGQSCSGFSRSPLAMTSTSNRTRLKLITRSLRLIDANLRENEEANRIFLDVLASKKHSETVLRAMNETGVLGRFVNEFGRVVAMMQFNMYHHYTVDEHTLRAIGLLAQIERGENQGDHPLATELFPVISNRNVLYLALFLHDIAKGRVEDHSIAGAKIARRLGPRFGFSPAETDQLAWLVENHLVMSIIAQSRDLSDRQTIRDFAAVVQTVERLRMLLMLTIADIKAVGPGVWNGWKGPAPSDALLRDRALPPWRPFQAVARPARRRCQGGTRCRAHRLERSGAVRLRPPPLRALLAARRSARKSNTCAPPEIDGGHRAGGLPPPIRPRSSRR